MICHKFLDQILFSGVSYNNLFVQIILQNNAFVLCLNLISASIFVMFDSLKTKKTTYLCAWPFMPSSYCRSSRLFFSIIGLF